MKISVASASAKLRQSNRADKRIELTMQNYLTIVERHGTFFRRTTDLE